jgi:WD40 repeat protein
VGNGPKNTIKVWDLPTRRIVATLKGLRPPSEPGWLAVSPDGKLVAAGAGNEKESVNVWDVAESRVVATLTRGMSGLLPFARRSGDQP